LNNNWQIVAVVLGAIVIASATYARFGRDPEPAGDDSDDV